VKKLNTPLNSNELTELNLLLEKAGLSLSYLHGLFCAVNALPSMIAPSQWQAIIFDDLEFDSEQELERTIALIFRFYNSVNGNLRDDNFKPFLYQEPGSLLDEVEIAQDWSIGYLRGVQLDDLWGDLAKSDEEMQTLLFPSIFLAGLALQNDTQVKLNVLRQEMLKAVDLLTLMNQTLYRSLQEIRKKLNQNNNFSLAQ
jgi:yecA family protein